MISEEQVLAAARELGFRMPDSFARIRAALEAAERAAWRPIEEANPGQAYLLYYPEMITGTHRQAKLPPMWKVGQADDTPFRVPTHFRPLPTPGEPG